MTLHISEAEVRAILTMPLAIEAVEEISRKQALGEAVVHPRRRFELPGGGFFHYMAAADLLLDSSPPSNTHTSAANFALS